MRYILLFFFVFLSFSAEAQQTDIVDFTDLRAIVDINVENNTVSGSVNFNFDILKETDSIYIDAKNIELEHLLVHNYDSVKISNDGRKIWIVDKFKPSVGNYMMLSYNVKPTKALYFNGWTNEGRNQVWTQGQGKYTSNWLPSFDDMNEKVRFDLFISFDKDYKVIANGNLDYVKTSDYYPNKNDYNFNMQKPMSSYLVALAIGKYDKKELTSKSGIPIELYYYPEDSNKVEPTYRYTKQMFDFLEDEIGVDYPWQNYKQVPVKDFLYSGMENTSCTIFSDDFMIDDISFVDKNYVNVNAHELAHQWFGDLVTETSGTHHWLQEGFATYYALLAERDIFGDDYYYWQLYEYAQELIAQEKAGQSTSLLDPKSSSTTFYKKGAWVLHILREQVGDKAFKKAIRKYLNKYAFKNVETTDFISEVENASGLDLSEFVETWLISKSLESKRMLDLIKTNVCVGKAIEMDDIRKQIDISEPGMYSSNLERDLPVLKAFFKNIKTTDGIAINENNYKDKDPLDFYKKIFALDNIKIRQAIAINLRKIPSELKTDYETLLNDNSYVTNEAALYNLWANFPQNRKDYLAQTKTIYGFNNYNVRTLWLTLAIATSEYAPEKTQEFYNELIGYTNPKQPFSRRQNAFNSMASLGLFDEEVLTNLIEASKHHNWRFRSFAKQLIESLSENEKYKTIISNLQDNQKQ